MTIRAELARLRPGMALQELSRAIRTEVERKPSGWFYLGGEFRAKVDDNDLIETLIFQEEFPAIIRIAGLRIGAKLDEVLAALRDCRLNPRSFPFDRTEYVGRIEDGNFLTARVGPQGFVRQLQITRAGRIPEDQAIRLILQEGVLSIDSFASADDTERLLEWASSFTFTTSKYEALFPAFAHWLVNEATPDDWHRAVPHWNWDYGIEPLLWIVRQTTCDRATALTAFYLSRPGEPGVEEESDKLMAEIRQRYRSGFYTRSEIAFDGPKFFREEGYFAQDADPEEVKLAVPEAMRVALSGRALPEIRQSYPWSLFTVNPPERSQQIPPPLSPAEQEELDRRRPARR